MTGPPTTAAARFSGFSLLPEPQLPMLQALRDYWQAKRGDRLGPPRADIRPEELRPHLPNLFLLDVVEGGRDLRFRLVGTALTQAARRDATGRLFSDVYSDLPEQLAQLFAVYRNLVETQQPVFARTNVFWFPHAAYRQCETAILPLSDDGQSVNMILGETQLLASS
jgi:hypothetical protein